VRLFDNKYCDGFFPFTVYRTRGEYANHYATDAVDIIGMRYNRRTIDIKPLVKVKLFYFFLQYIIYNNNSINTYTEI
jgi:hypothetical protein